MNYRLPLALDKYQSVLCFGRSAISELVEPACHIAYAFTCNLHSAEVKEIHANEGIYLHSYYRMIHVLHLHHLWPYLHVSHSCCSSFFGLQSGSLPLAKLRHIICDLPRGGAQCGAVTKVAAAISVFESPCSKVALFLQLFREDKFSALSYKSNTN